MIEKKFKDVRELLEEAENKALKGVGLDKKRPIVDARRMIRQAKEKLTEISKEIQR